MGISVKIYRVVRFLYTGIISVWRRDWKISVTFVLGEKAGGPGENPWGRKRESTNRLLALPFQSVEQASESRKQARRNFRSLG